MGVKDLEAALQSYGLSEKEIAVYLTLLQLGSSSLQEIAQRVDLPRTTTYNTLNYLIKRGLASFIAKKGVRHYEAAGPEKLLSNLKAKEELLKSVLPEMNELKKLFKRPSSAEVYLGTKGLFTILSDVFKDKDIKYYFGSYALSLEVLKHQPEHFRTLRMDRKIPAKIVIEPYREDIFSKPEYKKITEMRFHNSLKDFPCMIFIYDKIRKVAIYTLKKDLVGVIISNEQIAQAMKMIFDIFWERGKSSD
jgi:sugar-specific transcriptional regulator TrmB